MAKQPVNPAPEIPETKLAVAERELAAAKETLERFQDALLQAQVKARDLRFDVQELTESFRKVLSPDDIMKAQQDLQKAQVDLQAAEQLVTNLEVRVKAEEFNLKRAKDKHNAVVGETTGLKNRIASKKAQIENFEYLIRQAEQDLAHKRGIRDSIIQELATLKTWVVQTSGEVVE